MIYIICVMLFVYSFIAYCQGYDDGHADGKKAGIFMCGGDLKNE